MVARRNAEGFVEVGFTAEAMEAKELVEMIACIAVLVPVEAVEQLVDKYRRVETLAPIFDPTAWIRVQHHAGGHAELARAFLAFRKTIGDLAG
jgi:hypothetical protein